MPFSSNVCEELAAANKPISCSLSSNFQISPFISRHKGAIKLHRLAGALFDDEPHTMSAANVFNDAHSTVTYLFYALVFHYNFLQTYIWQWAVFNKCILPVFFQVKTKNVSIWFSPLLFVTWKPERGKIIVKIGRREMISAFNARNLWVASLVAFHKASFIFSEGIDH